MRHLLRLATLAIGLALGACATEPPTTPDSSGTTAPPPAASTAPVSNPAYEQALSRWVDKPEEDLVAAWGVPDRSQRLTDGGQALEYRRIDPTGHLLCSTLFTSDVYGDIRTWSYRGIDCRPPHLGDYGTGSS